MGRPLPTRREQEEDLDHEPAGRWRLWPRLGRALPLAIAVGALVGLVLVVRPSALATALGHFELFMVPLVLLGGVLWFILMGIRWFFLLRVTGSRLRMGDTVLLSVAGQAITAIIPFGDVTRAIFASESADLEIGAAAATVTVQELTFTLCLILLAAPGLVALHAGTGLVAGVVAGVAAIFTILAVPQLYYALRTLVAWIPIPRGLLAQADELQRQTATLLRRPDTVGWTLIDLVRAAVGGTVFWLILHGLVPDAIGWWTAAFVVAVGYIAGSISFIPGGTGANDASAVALLVLLGLDPGTAAAAVLLQRVTFTGLATTLGLTAYLVARRRFPLGSLFTRAAR
jgi:uncharacterized membrane protein YbhN (UPF0104 family)